MKMKYVAPEIEVISMGKAVILQDSLRSEIVGTSNKNFDGNPTDGTELDGTDDSDAPEVAAKSLTSWSNGFDE